MTAVHFRIENITPILSVRDMQATRAFYVGILGFQEAPWGTDEFTSFHRDRCGFYACRNGQGNPGTWIWIGVDGNLFELYGELQHQNVRVLQPPVNYSWALEMQILDPDGHVLRLGAEPQQDFPFADRPN